MKPFERYDTALHRDIQSSIGQELKSSYDSVVAEPLAEWMQVLLDELDRRQAETVPDGEHPRN
jgi:hypothetical protein